MPLRAHELPERLSGAADSVINCGVGGEREKRDINTWHLKDSSQALSATLNQVGGEMSAVERNSGQSRNRDPCPLSLWEEPLSGLGLSLFLGQLPPPWQRGLHQVLQLALAPKRPGFNFCFRHLRASHFPSGGLGLLICNQLPWGLRCHLSSACQFPAPEESGCWEFPRACLP